MARYVRANRAQSTLTGAISDSVATATVASIGSFPATIAGDQFSVLFDAGLATEELALVTGVAGAVLTVTRGTPAFAHAAAATVTFVETKDSLENMSQYIRSADASSFWTPTDHGFKAWNYDPAAAAGASVPNVGLQFEMMIKVRPDADISVSNVHIWVNVANVGGSQSFLGLANSAGAIIATSADQTTFGGTTGAKTAALVGAPFTLTAGAKYWVCLVNGVAGGTPVQFARRTWAQSGIGNIGLTGVNARLGTTGSGLALLTAFTPAANVPAVASGTDFWVAVS